MAFKNFSASYAGHVVDDNLGLQGMPANDRRYSNENLAQAFDWALNFSTHLETLGYDEFWMQSTTSNPKGTNVYPIYSC